ncbi:MAG: hypothetical protein AAF741_13410 [Bacteroidota bacterium]
MQNEPLAGVVTCSGYGVFAGLDDLPEPSLLGGIDNDYLSLTAKDEETAAWLRQGIRHLHTFGHLEAWRCFKKVTELDPECAMGYWGLAMCQPGFGGADNSTFLEACVDAMRFKSSARKVERDLIDALDITLRQGIYQAANNWEMILNDHPDEADAIAFSCIMLRQAVTNYEQSDALKEIMLKAQERFPQHVGLMHYYVHLLEERADFSEAIETAERMVELAPEAAHLRHMPGHLYFLAGQYVETVQAFSEALDLERAYHRRENIPFGANQNYLHNLHYLAVAQSELGNREAAMAAAEAYAKVDIERIYPRGGAALMQQFEGRALPALVAIRFGDFSDAVKRLTFWLSVPGSPVEEPLVRTYLEALRVYAQGMVALEGGTASRANLFSDRLEEYIVSFWQRGQQLNDETLMDIANQAYERTLILREELEGWIDNSDKNRPFDPTAWLRARQIEARMPYDEPPRLMYPVSESLARLHRWRGESELLEKAKQEALRRRPNSPWIMRI